MILLASTAALSLALQAEPADTSPLETAQAYMAAYSALDLEAMRTWLNDDTVFVDETWARNGDPAPEVHVGEDAFLGLLQDFIDNYSPLGLNFEWDHVFESNDRVVFTGWVNSRYATDDPEQLYQWRARQVTVLTIEDGQITHHRDFAAYETPEESRIPVE